MYKLILLDVDGTLVASKPDALPSPRTIEAINAASQKVGVALVTGRPYEFTKDVIKALSLTGFGVFNGGPEIINLETGEIVYRQSISAETTKEVLKVVLPYGYETLNTIGSDEIPVTSPDEITDVSDKVLVLNVPTHKAPDMVAALDAVEGIAVHLVSSWSDEDDFCISIVHEHASKRYGAERIMEMLGSTKEETIAIGDGHNDIPLIEAVGLGIAMGDAPAEVKELADTTTATLAEDGVAVAIEKYILTQE